MKVFLEGVGRGEPWQRRDKVVLGGPDRKAHSSHQSAGSTGAHSVNVSGGPLSPPVTQTAEAVVGGVCQPSRKSTHTPSGRPASEADWAKNSGGRREA